MGKQGRAETVTLELSIYHEPVFGRTDYEHVWNFVATNWVYFLNFRNIADWVNPIRHFLLVNIYLVMDHFSRRR